MSAPYPWLAPHWRQFEAWRAAGRLPHAILLSGPAGWGKAKLAFAMATKLLGMTPQQVREGDDGEVTERQVHADLRWVEADLEGGSRQIKIDQIREFAGFIASTSMSGVKVGVIVEAERMNTNAANALLKTLEEPAGATHLILITHRPGALLATIRSRCQVVPVMPSPDHARTWLGQTVGMSEAVDGLLWLSSFAPLRAMALLQDGSAAASLAALALLPKLSSGESSLRATLTAALAADPVLLLDGWLRALHDAEVGNSIPGAAGSWTHLAATARAVADTSSGDALFTEAPFTDAILQAKRHVLSTSNPNLPWLLEALLQRWVAA